MKRKEKREKTKDDARNSLALLLARALLFGAIEDLEELGDAEAHARVHVRLGALDVVVQVVPEQLHARDGVFCCLRGEVSGEED